MTNITPETYPRYKANPIFDGMPEYLKDHANFKKVQKAILDVGATRHSHGEIVDWAGCVSCQRKAWDRKEFMKKIGFASGAQYLEWRKVHEEITKRVPYPKYNST